ncbi:MAG: OmpH family outer membrane protein [Pirellulales bacterium]|nr:OmpH family outer membrane protein [Pirellulales bacterium]
MPTIRFSTALAVAATLLTGYASNSFGQGQAPLGQSGPSSYGQPVSNAGTPAPHTAAPTPGGSGVNGIAVVDISYILKTYPKLKGQLDGMKSKVEVAEAAARAEAEEIRKMQEDLKKYPENGAEFKRGEEAVLRRQGELQVKISMQKRQFIEEEGRIFFSVSREIDDAVRSVASRYGINLVLRFSGVDSPDPNDRNQTLQGMNKIVVYYDSRMDITPFVLTELQRGGSGAITQGVSTPPVPRR